MVINHTEMFNGRGAIVEIDGPLDSVSSPGFEDYINKLLARNIVFILFDSGKLEYVSSEGIGLLLFLQRKIYETNGFFVIFNMPDEIMSLYTLLGFDKVFRIAKDRAEAVQVMDRQMELRKKGLKEEPPAAPAEEVTIGPVDSMEPLEEPAPPPKPEEKPEIGPETDAPGPEPAPPGIQQRARIVECANCKSLMRVSRDGDYLCPHCNREFTVKSQEPAKRPVEPAAGSAFGSIIVECKKCKSLIRIKKPGSYRCPDCKTAFKVAEDQTVKF
ncbi:MAG: STAS domain-containing protein [Spirochaetes bacterium]|nr:STAS domain-containing protein [Spirochaetota bacterium]